MMSQKRCEFSQEKRRPGKPDPRRPPEHKLSWEGIVFVRKNGLDRANSLLDNRKKSVNCHFGLKKIKQLFGQAIQCVQTKLVPYKV